MGSSKDNHYQKDSNHENRKPSATVKSPTNCFRMASHKVWSKALESSPVASNEQITLAQKRALVEQTLQILFQCEFHILAEYVECFIPLLYSLHLIVLLQFPSSRCYSDMTDMTPAYLARSLAHILSYAWFEVLSFFCFAFCNQMKFGIITSFDSCVYAREPRF